MMTDQMTAITTQVANGEIKARAPVRLTALACLPCPRCQLLACATRLLHLHLPASTTRSPSLPPPAAHRCLPGAQVVAVLSDADARVTGIVETVRVLITSVDASSVSPLLAEIQVRGRQRGGGLAGHGTGQLNPGLSTPASHRPCSCPGTPCSLHCT